MNSEKHSAISPQTAGRSGNTFLELLRFWTAWRKHLYSNSNSDSRSRTSKERVNKILSRAYPLLIEVLEVIRHFHHHSFGGISAAISALPNFVGVSRELT